MLVLRYGGQRDRPGPQLRLRHGLGNPVGADPRLRAVGGGAGGRLEGRDAATAAGRLAALARRSPAGSAPRSSSCSYAAVALARSLFRKGADFTAAMAFEFASTNLVIELGIILALLLGWQFTLAEFVGGPLMIVVLALLFRRLPDAAPGRRGARDQADTGSARARWRATPRWTCPSRGGSIWLRLTLAERASPRSPLLRDGLGGDLEGHRRRPADRRARSPPGCPSRFWQAFFLVDHPTARRSSGDRSSGRSSAIISLRLLDRQRAARGGAVERRHQLRRRDRLHLRRPDRAADPQHLPQVLRLAG